MTVILQTILAVAFLAQQPRILELKRFEVIRVNPDEMRRLPSEMHAFFGDPGLDGELANSIDEAAKRVGFTPRLLNGKTPERVFVTRAANEEIRIDAAALSGALGEAKINDVAVPANWDGAVIRLQQPSGIIIDYGEFFIAQAGPSTLIVPDAFPFAECLELMSRIMGLSASDARSLRERFTANPTTVMPISKRFDMDIRQIPLPGGPGLLLQNADKGGELAFMWSGADRSYFLTGLLKEDDAVAVARALQ
jgi:hypothetical protein